MNLYYTTQHLYQNIGMSSAKPQVGHIHLQVLGWVQTLFLDPTLYTIVQDVYRVPDPVPNQNYAQRPRPVRIFSAIYHFKYHSLADSGPSYGQPPVDVSGFSMTSAFNNQKLQGSMPVGPTQATSFPMPSTCTVPTSDGLRTPTEVDQNLFDEPFMLDVNFEQIVFDDFVINMDNPNSFVRFNPPPPSICLASALMTCLRQFM